jgi:general secretion pathway protein H
MRISATGSERGFTLVELMVVMSIIAVASAAVLFSLPDEGRTLRDSAERFAAQAATLRDAAVMDASVKAIRLDPGGYHFEHFTDGRWVATNDKPFRAVSWPDGVRARIAPVSEARIRFDATGLADPSTLSLSMDGKQASVMIDAGGEIRLGQ